MGACPHRSYGDGPRPTCACQESVACAGMRQVRVPHGLRGASAHARAHAHARGRGREAKGKGRGWEVEACRWVGGWEERRVGVQEAACTGTERRPPTWPYLLDQVLHRLQVAMRRGEVQRRPLVVIGEPERIDAVLADNRAQRADVAVGGSVAQLDGVDLRGRHPPLPPALGDEELGGLRVAGAQGVVKRRATPMVCHAHRGSSDVDEIAEQVEVAL